MADFDLIIRGGTLADGTGADLREADVAVLDGKIAQVGQIAGQGAEEIDARGLLVTPGFVDLHTHYDAQVTWDSRFLPSTNHGVTSVLLGNCGVGFAPCKPEQREVMIDVMEGVEEIPGIVMAEGLPWNWTSFPDYLDALEARHMDADFAVAVPHIPVRVYVMGQRGVNREPATSQDMAEMAAIVAEGMAAGAFGFSTTRVIGHRDASGGQLPVTTASEDELMAIALAMRPHGKALFMSASEFDTAKGYSAEFRLLERIALRIRPHGHFPAAAIQRSAGPLAGDCPGLRCGAQRWGGYSWASRGAAGGRAAGPATDAAPVSRLPVLRCDRSSAAG